MDIKTLQAVVIDALEDVKAQDIKLFDTTHLTSLFDRLAIASGTSNRQTKALAASVRDKVKEHGGRIISVEGADVGEWVLVDLGDMIVHIMQPAIRDYYRLEEIWGEKEIKPAAAKRTTKRAGAASPAAGDGEAPKKRPRRAAGASNAADDAEPKAATRKTAAKRAAGVGAAAKTAGTTAAKKTAAKKAVGKTVKVAAPKSAGAAVKKTPAKTAAKKTAAKAPAKRAPAKSRTA